MSIRLVLADDHPVVLHGLEHLLRLEPGFEIVARCTDGVEALEAVRRHRPDILVLDIRMPRKGGLEVLREIREEKLPTKVVILAAAMQKGEALEALRLGVRGVVLKEFAPKMLIQCVRQVHAGKQWIERETHCGALELLLRREAAQQELAEVLTPRELELMRMSTTGLSNRQMAAQLGITEGTIKIHLHNIYHKLKIYSRLELVLLAQSKGLV
ncbi:MAG TPA: response regulator transcription factor [Gemmatimonadales bacterium]|jgi:DNA-binding NarL/FixJ family response regulator|nr:response regulator transcription factor [Gemmatimonadales bacterium]